VVFNKNLHFVDVNRLPLMLYSFLVIKKSDYIADKNPGFGKRGGTESRLTETS